MKTLPGVMGSMLLLLFATVSIEAHPVPYSYLNIDIRGNSVNISLVAHIYDMAHDLEITPMERLLDPAIVIQKDQSIRTLLGSRLHVQIDGQSLDPEWSAADILTDRNSLMMHLNFAVRRHPATVSIDTLMFPYDPTHQTFVNVYEDGTLATQVILDRNNTHYEYFSGSRQGVLAVLRKFIPSGIHHILIGPDHLLFLFGLLLLGGSTRRLLTIVTAFTIGHSVTLSLAALNIFSPPANIIEPAIALSIVYVGADNLLSRGGRDVRAWIALFFGFIHGFGFANVLREMGLPSGALGWSLFSFNFGVEIGQLLVVVAVASALEALRSRSDWAGRQVAFAGSITVIVAGSFWFIQRVFFPAGLS